MPLHLLARRPLICAPMIMPLALSAKTRPVYEGRQPVDVLEDERGSGHVDEHCADPERSGESGAEESPVASETIDIVESAHGDDPRGSRLGAAASRAPATRRRKGRSAERREDREHPPPRGELQDPAADLRRRDSAQRGLRA